MCIMHCKECIKECTPTGVDGSDLPFAWAAVDVSVHERVPFLERVMLFGPLEYNATVCVCLCEAVWSSWPAVFEVRVREG